MAGRQTVRYRGPSRRRRPFLVMEASPCDSRDLGYSREQGRWAAPSCIAGLHGAASMLSCLKIQATCIRAERWAVFGTCRISSLKKMGRTPTWFICLLALCLPLVTTEQVVYDDWKIHVDYYENVTLTCANDSTVGLPTNDIVVMWILPTTELLRPLDQWKNVRLSKKGFNLTIAKLDDINFGTYFCVITRNLSNGSEVSIVRKGINVEGAYFSQETTDEFKRDAIVGGIAAGVMLVACLATWLMCSYCSCCSATPKLIDDVLTDNGEMEAGTSGEHSGRKPVMSDGDNIYYIADGIPAKDVLKPELAPNSHNEHLLSTESGHYHSIGSLERDRALSDFEAKLDSVIEGKATGAATAYDRDLLDSGNHRHHDSIGSIEGNNSVFEEASNKSVKLDDDVTDETVPQETANVDDASWSVASTTHSDAGSVTDSMYSTPNKARKQKVTDVVDIVEGTVVVRTDTDSTGVGADEGSNHENRTVPIEVVIVNTDEVRTNRDAGVAANEAANEGPLLPERHSEVDVKTFNNYQNVLSNLVSNHGQKDGPPAEICAGYG